jgi:hypothetical protein
MPCARPSTRIAFFALDLLELDSRYSDPRFPIQFSDHVECDGAKFFKAAADLGLEGIVSKRAASLYRTGRSKNWLKTKNMVEVNSSF